VGDFETYLANAADWQLKAHMRTYRDLATRVSQIRDLATMTVKECERLLAALNPPRPEADPDTSFTCCATPMPWPTRTEDRTCPECGTVWEREPIDLGAGARIKTPAERETADMYERDGIDG
jgi:hypothetical protein